MPWLLNVAYFVLLAALSPMLLWRIVVRGKYRTGWREKLLGQVQRRAGDRPCLWFHAVSVGEVLQLEPVLKELRDRRPAVEFVISTTTPTGRSVAEAKFPRDSVCYFPLDFSWAVREAVARLRPTAIVLVELELWPNFILHARRSGIPVALINGRLSERSFRGYRRLRPLVSRLLGGLQAIAVQNSTYAERFLELGRAAAALDHRLDQVRPRREQPPQPEDARAAGRLRDRRIRAGLRRRQHAGKRGGRGDRRVPRRAHGLPALRLILVPRHKERFEDVARLIESRGLPLCRRSSASTAVPRQTRGPFCCWTHWASWPPVGGWPTWLLSAAVSPIAAGKT